MVHRHQIQSILRMIGSEQGQVGSPAASTYGAAGEERRADAGSVKSGAAGDASQAALSDRYRFSCFLLLDMQFSATATAHVVQDAPCPTCRKNMRTLRRQAGVDQRDRLLP
jgi:hypothetical protein